MTSLPEFSGSGARQFTRSGTSGKRILRDRDASNFVAPICYGGGAPAAGLGGFVGAHAPGFSDEIFFRSPSASCENDFQASYCC